MASSVKSLPNHYEILGVSPAASEEEINRAFSKAMGLFGARSVGAVAQIGLAFEVLRDPLRRLDYDRSLGLIAEPEPAPEPEAQPRSWMMAGAVHTDVHFSALEAPAPPKRRPAFDNVPPPVVEPEPRPSLEPNAEQKLAALVESLQRLAKPEPEPQPQPRPQPTPTVRPQPPAQAAPAMRPERQEPPRQEQVSAVSGRVDLEHLLAQAEQDRARDRWAQWRRPAIAVGGFLLAAGTIGALAGMSLKDAELQQAGVTMPLPRSTSNPAVAAPAPAALADTVGTPSEQPLPAAIAAPHARRIAPPQRPAAAALQQMAASQSADMAAAQSQPDASATDPLAPQPAAAQVVAASLPLPNAVVARTIERIGYPCGSVASTAAMDGAPGTFKVTCSSGHTYQAAPVRGRYRFRRLGGQ